MYGIRSIKNPILQDLKIVFIHGVHTPHSLTYLVQFGESRIDFTSERQMLLRQVDNFKRVGITLEEIVQIGPVTALVFIVAVNNS